MEESCKQPLNNEIPSTCNSGYAYRVLENGTREEIFKMLQHLIDSYYINERGNTMLHAILRNDKLIEKDVTDILLIFLTQGVCPNTKNNNEETALHLAVERRMSNAMDCLLQFKADLHVVDEEDNSIAHFFIEDEYEKCKSSMKYPLMNTVENRNAMENCSVTFLQFLIAKGVNFNSRNKQLQSASHFAIVYYLPHILCILLHVTDDLMTLDMYHKTFLELILEDSISMSRLHLPDENQYPGYKSRCAAVIFRILLEKVISDDYERAHFADTQIKDRRRIDVLQALINYYLSNCENRDYAATLEAEKLHMMEFLRDTDIDLSFKSNNGQTLLHWLAEEKITRITDSQFSENIYDLLICRGCEVNSINSKGKSVLHVAAARTNVPMVRKLMELGADLHCRDKGMRTPLHEAVNTNESRVIVELLLNSEADVNVEDSKGRMPLHIAEFNESLLMITLLLSNGADIHAKLPSTNILSLKKDLDGVETFNEYYWPAEPTLFDAISIDKLLKCKANLNDAGVICLIQRLRGEEIFSDLKHHWVRLEAIGLPLNREYELLIGSNYLMEYLAECLQEIEKLKKTFINGHKSLYDFLRMHFSNRVAYVNNEKLRKIVESRTLFEQFKNYSVMLRASYREAVTREIKYFNPAKEAFYELIEGKLTADSIDYILAYLDNEDLISIVNAKIFRKNCI